MCAACALQDPPFELHYPIDGDKVGAVSVKMTFNKEARWTKALKYMLTNLKLCVKWMIERQEMGQGRRISNPGQASNMPNADLPL